MILKSMDQRTDMFWKKRHEQLKKKPGKAMNRKRMAIRLAIILVFSAAMLSGCGYTKADADKIVLDSGFEDDEVFNILSDKNVIHCYYSEAQLYVDNLVNEYRKSLGDEIWYGSYHDDLVEMARNKALSRISKVKALNLMAEEEGIVLDAENASKADDVAAQYFDTLSDDEKESLDITLDDVQNVYREYALADYMYDKVTASIQTEISDDEARIVQVESILFSTKNEDGSQMDDNAKAGKLETAQKVLKQVRSGADFDSLILEYNDDSESSYSLSRSEDGTTDAFTEAAFALDKDEVSDIIETDDGYRIVKCINNFDRSETEANKVKLLESRKGTAFGEQFDKFEETLETNMNDKLWSGIGEPDKDITTSELFELYSESFDTATSQ
ncbi:MAG: peptidylprolyl isomerase [Lachnospiraceae bacterium]|nr:peptidylprolyl isomerase [Lachnospiraceae bacterium]